MLFRSILTGATVLAVAGILAAPHAHAATITAGSSSDALSAVFSVNGNSGSLPNQAVASGKAPPAYTKTIKLPSYSKTATLSALTLSATATDILDTASAAGADSKGGVTAIAAASIGSLKSALSSPLGTALTVTSGTLTSSASFATTKAGATTAKGSASISGLTITAPAFGIKSLTYSGKPAANHILYQNAAKTVVVYLNRQITTANATGEPKAITVSAVTLQVKNYQYSGSITVSGEVDVATSTAN